MVRHSIWRLIAIGILVIPIILAKPSQSLACDCIGGGPYGDVAFVGRILVVFEGDWVRERLRATKRRFFSTFALLAVEEYWYGPKHPFFVVTGGYDADCGVAFEPGISYVIYGTERRRFGPLETTICDGSSRLDEAMTRYAQRSGKVSTIGTFPHVFALRPFTRGET